MTRVQLPALRPSVVNDGRLVVAAVMQKQDERAAETVYRYAQGCLDEWLGRSPVQRQRAVFLGLAARWQSRLAAPGPPSGDVVT